MSDHNITQVQLGEKLGLSPQSLTSVIKGNPTVKKLEDIAVAIGCDITDLFYPDPAEEAETQEEGAYPTMKELQDIIRKAYPSIKKENVDKIVDKLAVMNAADEGACTENDELRTENGENHADNGMMRTFAYCPHCGKKVTVGVVLIGNE
ncbi:MAG TPA: helix-turn-helix transcriptional regulator [Segatella copri]|uniref:helix-turn-helix transcriptional regulator n=1 Tax=Prevotella sp. TaxID=59823 RepID=UPI002CFF1877|nr:helix-turn-helix transcriptional regulator [Segatella copri]